jgi:hypothetical protein
MERSDEEKAAAQESACGSAGPPGWLGTRRSKEAREQGEWPQGRPGQKPQEDHCGAAQCAAATPWAPQEAVNAVISLICARYGALAIGRGPPVCLCRSPWFATFIIWLSYRGGRHFGCMDEA